MVLEYIASYIELLSFVSLKALEVYCVGGTIRAIPIACTGAMIMS